MKYFFTIVNYNYVLRGLALYKSFEKIRKKDERFIVITVDKKSYQILKKQKSLISIKSEEFECFDLKKIKKERKINEYCWTLKPIGIDYIFKKFLDSKWVTYLDSDSMIYKSFSQEYKKNYDVILTPHRCQIEYFKEIENNVGNFNAGFIAFKNTTNGKNVLNFWKKKCLNWCFDIPDKSRYADQKYLNDIPKKFNKIQTKPSVGLNLAPWNIATNEKTLEIPKKLQKSLSFYHMQGLKIFNENIYNIYSDDFLVKNETFQSIYKPYINLLKQTYCELKKDNQSFKIQNEFFFSLKFIFKKIFFGIKNLKVI